MYRRSVDGPGIAFAAVVLAAGTGSRFSPQPGAKLLANLAGRPLLAHVLLAVRGFGPAATVVVLGRGAPDIERAIEWRAELRVINRTPERGLASSLQAGIHALRALPGEFDGAFIVLGDQPRLRVEVLQALASAADIARPKGRSLLVPRYETAGPRNPVLLLRPAWGWVDGLRGDRGLGPLIASRPDAVLEVPVPGDMPDVDEPADLERLRALED